MNDTIYTPEVMRQTGRIYDKLEQLPPDKRFIAKLVADSFINGLNARSQLDTPAAEERPGA